MKASSFGVHAIDAKIQQNWGHMQALSYVRNALMDLFCQQIH